MSFWKQRFNAAGIHLAASLLIALVAATLVFAVWYPYPYSKISGGRELFMIVVAVDVILGPLLTLAIFNCAKPVKELRRDVAVVVILQLAALGYGLWTVSLARPVHLVFEIDRFRVVHAVDVVEELLPQAPNGLTSLPVFDRGLLSVRDFSSAAEGFQATMAALEGVYLGTRPDLWQPYAVAATQIRKVAKPAGDLLVRFPQRAITIDDAIIETGRTRDHLLSLPLISRHHFWTALLDSETLEIVGFLPVDSF